MPKVRAYERLLAAAQALAGRAAEHKELFGEAGFDHMTTLTSSSVEPATPEVRNVRSVSWRQLWVLVRWRAAK